LRDWRLVLSVLYFLSSQKTSPSRSVTITEFNKNENQTSSQNVPLETPFFDYNANVQNINTNYESIFYANSWSLYENKVFDIRQLG
jgi:hypothetical protein